MHASPPSPFRNEMEMPAHKKRPRGEDCIQGKRKSEGKHRKRRQFEQQVASLARCLNWSSWKILVH